MPKNEVDQKRNKDVLPILMAGSKKKIYLEPKIGQQIFIYGEYLKRKFYLDCNYVREDGRFKKQNSRYMPLIISDYNELLNRFNSILDIHIKSGTIFIDNSPIYKRAFSKSQNIYQLIQYLYKASYRLFRRKVISLETQDTKWEFLLHTTNEFEEYSFIVSPYSYERILWIMSDFERMNTTAPETEFGFFAKNFYFAFEMERYSGAYHLYVEIVKKYHLYMRDLTDMATPEKIIKSGYSKYYLPRFCDLPKLSLESSPFKDLVTCDYNPLKEKLALRLDIKNNNSIEEFGEFVKNLTIYYSYLKNEDNSSDMDEDNYKLICAYLDSSNPHNATSRFEDRIDGLYLWDKLYRHSSKKSASNEIEIFLKKIKKQRLTPALKRRYQNILQSTTQSIERGEMLPIA